MSQQPDADPVEVGGEPPEVLPMSAMPAIPANTGEVIQVVIRGKIEAQDCLNVIYFRANSPVQDILTMLLAKVAACIIQFLIPHLADTYTLERITGRVVSPALGPETWWSPDADDLTQGALTSGGSTSFVSATIGIRALRGGPSGRGFMRIGGIPEAATANSFINPEHPLWAGLIAFCDCLLSQFHSNTDPQPAQLSWGVMSRKIGGLKPPFLPAGFSGVFYAAPNRLLGSTNSRKVGRGS